MPIHPVVNLNMDDAEIMAAIQQANVQAHINAGHWGAPPPHPPAGAFQQWHQPIAAQAAPVEEEFAIPALPEDNFDAPNPFANQAVSAKRKAVIQENHAGKKMQELISYPSLKLNKVVNSAYEKGRTPVGAPFKWTTQQGYVGIEVEVENIIADAQTQAYWSTKPDGSLRNHGMEFVSVPLAVKQIQLALEHLNDRLYATNKPDFSNRTSVHVHVNCRDMTQDQVFNFVLLYSIFEKHFFSVAGGNRLNSIYCVPVYRCNILSNAKSLIYGFDQAWQKYCALNLLPLINNNQTGCYGTIEFRHLYGTTNPTELMAWINDILCLRQWAMVYETPWLLEQIKEMNTTSQYLAMYNTVFENGRKVLTQKKDFEDCISNTKRELFGMDYWNTLRRTENSPYWNLCAKLGIRG